MVFYLDLVSATLMCAFFILGAWVRCRFASPSCVVGLTNKQLEIMLVALSLLPRVFLVNRDDRAALLTSGLSLSNQLSVVCAFMAVGISLCLFFRNPSPVIAVIQKGGYWLYALLLIYLVSATWSVWPLATLYRVCELFGFVTLMVYALTVSNPLSVLLRLLKYACAILLLISLPDAVDNIKLGLFFGASRSNQAALLAACLILIQWHIEPHRWLKLLFPAFCLICFGSTTTACLLFLSILLYAAIKSSDQISKTVCFSGFVVGLGMVIIFFLSPQLVSFAFKSLSVIFQKDIVFFSNLTGRTDIWDQYQLTFGRNLFGSGFWAAERLYAIELIDKGNWGAAQAHNSFYTAWISGGLVAAGALIALFLSTRLHLSGARERDIPLGISLLVLLLFNCLTFSGVGGGYNLWYMILMTLIVLPVVEHCREG